MVDVLKKIYPKHLIIKNKKELNEEFKKYIIIINKNEYEVHNKTN